MVLITDNLRLQELAVIVEANKPFYDQFIQFLSQQGYSSLHEFVTSKDSPAAYETIYNYLTNPPLDGVVLLDGIARPYPTARAKWLLLGWIFRDAPSQRLEPLVKSQPGHSSSERRAYLLNELRLFVGKVFPSLERWDWIPISEVFMDRLEGSRRAIKGNLIEVLVRQELTTLFAQHNIKLQITQQQVKIGNETYDVEVVGANKRLLLPVKSRETMGGGHARLFTRDIHKSIDEASKAGVQCLPLVIAESWSGDLAGLSSTDHIYIELNPNQLPHIRSQLQQELAKRLPLFRTIV